MDDVDKTKVLITVIADLQAQVDTLRTLLPRLTDLSVSPLTVASGETVTLTISGNKPGSTVLLPDKPVGWEFDNQALTISLTAPDVDDDVAIQFDLAESLRPAIDSPHFTSFTLLVTAKEIDPPVDLEPYIWGDPRLAWGQSGIAWGQSKPDGAAPVEQEFYFGPALYPPSEDVGEQEFYFGSAIGTPGEGDEKTQDFYFGAAIGSPAEGGDQVQDFYFIAATGSPQEGS